MTDENTTLDAIKQWQLQVACPFCGAGVGEHCKPKNTRYRNPNIVTHAARLRVNTTPVPISS